MFKYILKNAPLYMLLGMIYSILTGLRTVYTSMYLLKYTLTAVEEGQPFVQILIFLLWSLVGLGISFLYDAFWFHVIKPVYSEKLKYWRHGKIFS